MNAAEVAGNVCAHYLAAADARYPGLVTGLYLVGSAALDDLQAGRSDVDFVAVTTRPVNSDAAATLHAELRARYPKPYFDGLYVTADELRAIPDGSGSGVAVIEGVVHANSRAERHPVTWLTLAQSGIAIRGPAPDDLGIAADVGAAQSYSRDNLVSYWQPWVARHRRFWSRRGLHGLTGDAVVWSVLGVARLHAMIAAGRNLSKSGAGLYAREVFPLHRPILDCALALRCGEWSTFPGGALARRRAMLDCLDDLIADAHGRRRG
jgi:hypothetical protein